MNKMGTTLGGMSSKMADTMMGMTGGMMTEEERNKM
jgi:acyl-coenzyme A thioesterase PaaI-like protein